LPKHSLFDLLIEPEGGKTPPFALIYNLLEIELAVLRKYLEKYLSKGWI